MPQPTIAMRRGGTGGGAAADADVARSASVRVSTKTHFIVIEWSFTVEFHS